MRYMSARIAGIGHVVSAADRNEAAEHGFDYRSTYRLFAEDPVHWEAPSVEKLGIPKRLEPFQAFRSGWACSRPLPQFLWCHDLAARSLTAGRRSGGALTIL